jgi:very-short-patch-repair endonuclease
MKAIQECEISQSIWNNKFVSATGDTLTAAGIRRLVQGTGGRASQFGTKVVFVTTCLDDQYLYYHMRNIPKLSQAKVPESWEEFLVLYGPTLRANTKFEYEFVLNVLSKVGNIKPQDVEVQYKFVDRREKRRFIDFVISVGVKPKIAIEVDGYDKRGYGEMSRDDFNDFTFRQNEISTQLGFHVLRFANGEFLNHPSDAIRQIEESVEKVWQELRPGVFARGLGGLFGGIRAAVSSATENAAIAFHSEREIQSIRQDRRLQEAAERAARRIAAITGDVDESSIQEKVKELLRVAGK